MWSLAVIPLLIAGIILGGGTALAEDAPVTGTFVTHEVTFLSHGASLSGTVIVPRSPAVAAAVFVQGAGPLSADEKGRIAMGVIGLFALAYGVDALRKRVFVMGIRNLAKTVEIDRANAPVRYWTYVSLFVVLGVVLLWCAWNGVPA